MSKSVRVVLSLCGALAISLGAAACGSDDDDSGSDGDKTITFGASVSLTGDLAAEAKTAKDGYDFMVDEINDQGGIPVGDDNYQVEIKYYDDKSDADTAVKLYDRLITQDDVDFLLGPYSSGVTEAVAPIAERNDLPMVVAHAASTSVYSHGYEYLFGTLTPVEHYGETLLEAAQTAKEPPHTLALINENALFPTEGIEATADKAADLGMEVVYQAKYPTGTPDMSSLIAGAKAKDPDMLIAAGYSGDMIQLMRQAKEAQFAPAELGFLLGPTVPGFIDDLGADADFTLEPVQWTPKQPGEDEIFGWTAADYADKFEAAKGYVPDYHPPQSSAALEVYYDALQRAGTLDPTAVRDAIADTDLQTFYGKIQFNDLGQNDAKGMEAIQVQDGKPVVIYPEDSAEGDLIAPFPTWESR
jgi:branched-chain amino acid transport system substrate-binding protein